MLQARQKALGVGRERVQVKLVKMIVQLDCHKAVNAALDYFVRIFNLRIAYTLTFLLVFLNIC